MVKIEASSTEGQSPHISYSARERPLSVLCLPSLFSSLSYKLGTMASFSSRLLKARLRPRREDVLSSELFVLYLPKYAHVQLAMKRHYYGPEHGIRLEPFRTPNLITDGITRPPVF